MKTSALTAPTINAGFTDGGVWDQASVRRCHMTVQGNEVASFSLKSGRRSWLRSRARILARPQVMCYLSKHAGVSCSGIQAPNATLQEPLNSTLFGHCTSLLYKNVWRFCNMSTSPAKFMWRTFVVVQHHSTSTLFELDLDVYSICVLADRVYCSGWGFEAVVSKARL